MIREGSGKCLNKEYSINNYIKDQLKTLLPKSYRQAV